MNILTPFFIQKNVAFEKVVALSLFLMVMLEKFKELRDKGEESGTFFTGLSEALDYIEHDLLIRKIN